MNSTTRLALVTLASVAVLAALAWLSVSAAGGPAEANQDGEASNSRSGKDAKITKLANQCSASVGEDGFGNVTIDRRLTISNESGEILVPCRVRLNEGGSLKLNNVDLASKHLSISDYQPNGETRVVFNNSELTAAGKHGFLLQLSDASDSIALNNTDLDYPLSVWVRVSDRSPDAEVGGGNIQVNNSSVHAAEPESEDGIQFVAGELGGEARFNKVVLDTGEPRGKYQDALLFAGECQVNQVKGFPNRCGSQAMLDGLEEEE